MVISKNKFATLFVAIAILLAGLIFLTYDKAEELEMEKLMNKTYFDYVQDPNDYILTKATILDEFDYDYGDSLNFFPETNGWLVSVQIDQIHSVETTVLRDVKNDSVGAIIDVAYQKDESDEYTSHTLHVTRLEYIENLSARKSYTVAIATVFILLFSLVIFTVLSFYKTHKWQSSK